MWSVKASDRGGSERLSVMVLCAHTGTKHPVRKHIADMLPFGKECFFIYAWFVRGLSSMIRAITQTPQGGIQKKRRLHLSHSEVFGVTRIDISSTRAWRRRLLNLSVSILI